jgi:hypothetical protein
MKQYVMKKNKRSLWSLGEMGSMNLSMKSSILELVIAFEFALG